MIARRAVALLAGLALHHEDFFLVFRHGRVGVRIELAGVVLGPADPTLALFEELDHRVEQDRTEQQKEQEEQDDLRRKGDVEIDDHPAGRKTERLCKRSGLERR